MSQETITWLRENTLIGLTDIRGKAWHALNPEDSNHYKQGVPVEDVRSRLFHWTPQIAPVQASLVTDDGVTVVESKDQVAIVRPDTATILGIHGKGYTVHGYDEWLTGNLSKMLDEDGLVIGSAGLLSGGAVAFVQIQTPETITGPGGQAFNPFILAVTSLNGKYKTTYKGCVQRVVCDNTLAVGVAERTGAYTVKHTKHSAFKAQTARDALEIIQTTTDAFSAEVDALLNLTVTDAQWEAFLDSYSPLPDEPGRGLTVAEKRRDTLSDLYYSDERVGFTGTAWGVQQAVDTYAQWETRVNKGGQRFERTILEAASGTLWDADKEAMAILASVGVGA